MIKPPNSNLPRMLMMNKMPTFSCFLLSLIIFSTFSAKARILDQTTSSTAQSGRSKQDERLIRGFNLFPGLEANIVQDDPAETQPRLVEKQFPFPNIAKSLVADSNGTVQELGHHAGYYRLPNTKGARMFYFFFESRNKSSDVPVVIWLTGGPGCSGSLALFYENGPFHLTDNLSLVWNDYGWDMESNLIYVDQQQGPVSVILLAMMTYAAALRKPALTSMTFCMSVSKSNEFIPLIRLYLTELLTICQAFFEKHPQYAKNNFYITGESYAGHYIPAFAAQVQQKNKAKAGIPINLKGIAIGNGLTNPEIQYDAYPDYALDMKLVDRSEYDNLKQLAAACEVDIQQCNTSSTTCPMAQRNCQQIFEQIVSDKNGINYYDIRKQCYGSLCYDFSNAENFLNQVSVKTALGVGDIEFVSCSSTVYDAMSGDWIKNYAVGLPALLQDGVKILIYAGEYDLICNWLGNSRWVEALEWSGHKDYVAAPTTPFTVDGEEAGLQKSYGPLTFLKVHNSGHMVPMDQPKYSLEMLKRWLQGSPL